MTNTPQNRATMGARSPLDVWTCHLCGSDLEAACAPSRPRQCCVSPELIERRLNMAGATSLAMRARSPYPPAYQVAWPDFLHNAIEAYGWTGERTRPAIPDASDITAMDVAFQWLQLIPQHRYILRRIVAARSLVSPVTGRHILNWRAIATMIGADYRAIQRWHGAGINIIVERLQG